MGIKKEAGPRTLLPQSCQGVQRMHHFIKQKHDINREKKKKPQINKNKQKKKQINKSTKSCNPLINGWINAAKVCNNNNNKTKKNELEFWKMAAGNCGQMTTITRKKSIETSITISWLDQFNHQFNHQVELVQSADFFVVLLLFLFRAKWSERYDYMDDANDDEEWKM